MKGGHKRLHIEQKVNPQTGQRFCIAFPEGYVAHEPAPLILALHFAGHGTPFYGRFILEELVEPGLRELGAIIVAPDCTGGSWNEPKSEADVLHLLDLVSGLWLIDGAKVVVTGYRMGGNGAWHLAAHHPGKFSAAVVVSGWPPAEIARMDWQVPVYVIHSQADEFIPFEPTQSLVAGLTGRGVEVELVLLEGITHFETIRFIQPLKSAVPWIKSLWREKS